MILLYTHKITNRLNYTLALVFGELLNTNYEVTTNAEAFLAYEGIKINYSKEPLKSGIFIAGANLLFTRRLENIDVEVGSCKDIITLFPTPYRTSNISFDPFAAAFYMVSRYEEYVPYQKDVYGRFDASQSIAFREHFLHLPIVNYWVRLLAETIKEYYPQYQPQYPKYSFLSTLDIDAAWAYKEKGLLRTAGAYARSLINRDIQEVKQRTRVLLGKEQDPFDTFEYQLALHKQFKVRTLYFILFADYGENDKNISTNNSHFQRLITYLGDYSEIGIHPSYNSNFDTKKLEREVRKLSNLINRNIYKSRQHFLKLHLPHTYRNLINLEINNDYTMGYAERTGFRAGIANSFFFYDLDTDIATTLRVHPFMLMDGSLRDYQKIEAEEAMSHIIPLIDEVKKVGGEFISLWHNESLSDQKRWRGWRKVYEEMINYALP